MTRDTFIVQLPTAIMLQLLQMSGPGNLVVRILNVALFVVDCVSESVTRE